MKETYQFTWVSDKGDSIHMTLLLCRTTELSMYVSIYRRNTGTHSVLTIFTVCLKGPEVENTGI